MGVEVYIDAMCLGPSDVTPRFILTTGESCCGKADLGHSGTGRCAFPQGLGRGGDESEVNNGTPFADGFISLHSTDVAGASCVRHRRPPRCTRKLFGEACASAESSIACRGQRSSSRTQVLAPPTRDTHAGMIPTQRTPLDPLKSIHPWRVRHTSPLGIKTFRRSQKRLAVF